jgi:hypothetical protein
VEGEEGPPLLPLTTVDVVEGEEGPPLLPLTTMDVTAMVEHGEATGMVVGAGAVTRLPLRVGPVVGGKG